LKSLDFGVVPEMAKEEGGGCRDDPVFEKQVCTQLTPSPLTTISDTG